MAVLPTIACLVSRRFSSSEKPLALFVLSTNQDYFDKHREHLENERSTTAGTRSIRDQGYRTPLEVCLLDDNLSALNRRCSLVLCQYNKPCCSVPNECLGAFACRDGELSKSAVIPYSYIIAESIKNMRAIFELGNGFSATSPELTIFHLNFADIGDLWKSSQKRESYLIVSTSSFLGCLAKSGISGQ